MKLKHALILSFAALALVGCAGRVTNNQTEGFSSITSNTTPSPTEPITKPTNVAQATIVKTGSFVSGEHPTQGTASIVTENGKSFLELDQGFKTSTLGPDLVVILHRSNNVIGSTKPPAYPLREGDYLFLAPLKKYSGSQRYAIPAKVKLADYQSAAIWCRKFNATFGAARLIGQ